MKLIFAILLICITTSAFADTYVRGHTRKDGTYVEPHYRSSPDNSKFNNYSSEGNLNPYSGKEGKVDPYKVDTPYQLNPSLSDPYKNSYGN